MPSKRNGPKAWFNGFDAFVSSCEMGMIKPDPNIWRLAMGLARARLEQCVYFDDRIMRARAARKSGSHAYRHQTFENTRQILETLTNTPLTDDEPQLLL